MALSGGACDCIPVHTFMKSMGPNVFLAEVIEGGGKCPGSHGRSPRLRVKILEHIVGDVRSDTVLIQEGVGEACMGNLVSRNEGDTLIITGQISYCLSNADDTVIRLDGDSPYIRIGSCVIQSLRVQRGQVYGMITKNKYRKRQETVWWLQKYSPLRFLSEETHRRMNGISLRPEDEQHMSIEQLKKLVQKAYKR